MNALPLAFLAALGGCAATVDGPASGSDPIPLGSSGAAGSTTAQGAAGASSGGRGGEGGSPSIDNDASSNGGSSTGLLDAGALSSDAGPPSSGDAAPSGSSPCSAGKYVLCEDFETTAEGAVPTGWTKHGAASVASDQSSHGQRALKIGAAATGERRISTGAAKLGSGHWGRIFYRVQLPVPGVFVHSTLVALQGIGPTRGNEEVRVVDTVKDANGKHQFLYNVQPSGAEFGKGSPYNWTFDGKWHCAEWHIDAPTQSYHFYFDGAEVTSIALDNGPGKYNGTDIPMSFTEMKVGWNNYQSAPPGFVAWIDDVALDVNRIGCGQ